MLVKRVCPFLNRCSFEFQYNFSLFLFVKVKRKLASYKCFCKKVSCPTCPACRWQAKGKQYPKTACPFKCEICACICEKKFNSSDMFKTKATLSSPKPTSQSSYKTNSFGTAVDIAKEVLNTISIELLFFIKRFCFVIEIFFLS